MTLKQSSKPYGYRNLLVYKKAEELQHACAKFTMQFPREKTLIALADQMDRSARSVKQNIVEGETVRGTVARPDRDGGRRARAIRHQANMCEGKRNSTHEYYDFLGFSIGANAELEEDCNDVIKGIYEKGERGIMGLDQKGGRGEKGIGKGTEGKGMGLTEMSWTLAEVERLPFYPLDSRLPPLIQLKLRCKELNMLLTKLQHSLADKMTTEHRLPVADRLQIAVNRQKQENAGYEEMLREAGMIRLKDGRVVPKAQGDTMGEKGIEEATKGEKTIGTGTD